LLKPVNPFILAANFSMHLHTCLNCQTEFTASFCNNCGQKLTHRYSVTHVLHELVHVFTHADKGIFSFAWNIVRKPGVVALDLVEGRRKRYFNLFQYLLLIVGFVTFLMVKTNFIDFTMRTMNDLNEVKVSSRQAELQAMVANGAQKYNNVLQMMLIPVYALFSWLFLGKKRKYNYAENIVLHTAASAQSNTLAILTTSLLFFSLAKDFIGLIMGISFAVMMVTFTLSYKQFYKISWLKAFGYALLVFIISYIIQIIVVGIFTVFFIMLHN
jgi:hypothetical protein